MYINLPYCWSASTRREKAWSAELKTLLVTIVVKSTIRELSLLPLRFVECECSSALSCFQCDDSGGSCNIIIRPSRHLMENLPSVFLLFFYFFLDISSLPPCSLHRFFQSRFLSHLYLLYFLHYVSPPVLSHTARWEMGKQPPSADRSSFVYVCSDCGSVFFRQHVK